MTVFNCETCSKPFKATESGHCKSCRLAYVRKTFSSASKVAVPSDVQRFMLGQIRAMEAR